VTNAKASVYSATLKVSGARLYYEVQGNGPVLLMIPGGPTDAGIFTTLAASLADRYTVVRYDPRGNSRSVLDRPWGEQDMDRHGDDAAEILAAVGAEPAYVLGSSGGAQIGLNLAARHPQRVHTLVAHEPPCVRLLPDAEEQYAFTVKIYETYRSAGVGIAMEKFMLGAGLAGDGHTERAVRQLPPSVEMRDALDRIRGNTDYFLAHGFRPISLYSPDVAVLKAGTPRIIVGVGQASRGQLAWRSALTLAQRLWTTPVTFPGGHGGYNEHPAAFAERLDQAIRYAF
jgi:pimeloyl-ACP methyl ester carboxylesterase